MISIAAACKKTYLLPIGIGKSKRRLARVPARARAPAANAHAHPYADPHTPTRIRRHAYADRAYAGAQTPAPRRRPAIRLSQTPPLTGSHLAWPNGRWIWVL